MDTVVFIKNLTLAAFSTACGWTLTMLGGWDVTLGALVAFMAADYLTGLVVAGVFHRSSKTQGGRLESRAGFKGILRKCAVLGMVFLAVMLDRATGAGFIRPAVCLFFLANEGLSLLENLGLMGVSYPAFLRDMLEVMKARGDTGEKEEK